MCVFVCVECFCVIKWGSIVQVSTSWTSQTRGARSYTVHCVWVCMCMLRIYVFMCMHLCAFGVCAFVHMLLLFWSCRVRGYMALS